MNDSPDTFLCFTPDLREGMMRSMLQVHGDLKAHYVRNKNYGALLPKLNMLVEMYHTAGLDERADRLLPLVGRLQDITNNVHGRASATLQRSIMELLRADLRQCAQWHAEASGLGPQQAALVAQDMIRGVHAR